MYLHCDFDEWFSELNNNIETKNTLWLTHDFETTKKVVDELVAMSVGDGEDGDSDGEDMLMLMERMVMLMHR